MLGIVFFQLIVTSIFPTVCVLVPSVGDVFKNSEYLTTYIVFDTVAIFISLIFLFFFKDKHPYNLLILTLFTLCISFLVGITCLAYQPATIAQGFLLTLGDVLLCGGAVFFWRKTKLFIFGYIIINLIFILSFCLIFQFIFMWGTVMNTVYASIGAVLFSLYLIVDLWLTYEIYEIDDYVIAAVDIYLDIINIFIYILALLGTTDN